MKYYEGFWRSIFCILAILIVASGIAQNKEAPVAPIYQIEVNRITGETVTLSEYSGKVLLIVNTASKCGFTKQYDGLQKLYETYQDSGFVVLGFPSNDFLKQEPGTNEEIQTFCRLNFGVAFPMFEKIRVKGKAQHPLYQFLTKKETDPEFSGEISWNFNKFLIARDGRIAGRFGSKTEPQDEELVFAIEKELAK